MKYLYDVTALVGLGLFAGGLAMIHVPLALCATGVLLLAFSVLGARNKVA